MENDLTKYHFLLIEDNPGDVLIITEYLEEVFKYVTITVCKNFHTLIELTKSNDIEFHACLLDLSLPDHQGAELIEDLQKIITNVPIIILTGNSNLEFSVQSMKLGITDYLIKNEVTSLSLYKSIIYSLERKKNIAKIKASEQRYSHLFNYSTLPKILFELESKKIIQVNMTAIKSYGYTESEFLSMSFERIFEKSKFKSYLRQIKQKSYKSEHVHITKEGKIINVELTTSLLDINGLECALVSCNDITEKVKFQHYVNETIIKTQEEERYGIGAELHDNVCQVLATSQIYLSILKEKVNNDENVQYFNTVNNLIQKSLNEIRNISHQMAPSFFEDSKLSETLPALLEYFSVDSHNSTCINMEIDPSLNDREINQKLHLNLFRILQEQLNNIQKYSKAKNVNIQIRSFPDFLSMKIEDDGVGFNRNINKKGIGLSNMERRVELLNGRISIDSEVNRGCLIFVVLPM